MADYSEDKKSAYDDIKENGTSIVIRQHTPGVYNPITEVATGATWASNPTYGLFTGYSDRFIDGERIKVGDMRLLISSYGLSITLDEGDEIVAGGVTWKVQNPNPIAPSNDPIIWKAQVRK